MGWIARSQLASAVSNAGAMGIIETSSGELDVIRDEIRKMRDLTDKPFGVNIAQAFVRDPSIVEFVVDQGVKFVTTSAGSPTKYTAPLKEAGLTVFHVVPEPRRRAEGGRRRRGRPHRRGRRGRRLQEPAPGRHDGAAAARRVEGRRAGDRGRRVRRRPDHGGRARARRRGRAARHPDGVVGREPDARQLEAGGRRRQGDRHRLPQPAHVARRCARCAPSGPTRSSSTTRRTPWALFGNAMDLYFGGDMEAAIALSGQVAGRIDEVRPVAEIIEECAEGCLDTLAALGQAVPRVDPTSDRNPLVQRQRRRRAVASRAERTSPCGLMERLREACRCSASSAELAWYCSPRHCRRQAAPRPRRLDRPPGTSSPALRAADRDARSRSDLPRWGARRTSGVEHALRGYVADLDESQATLAARAARGRLGRAATASSRSAPPSPSATWGLDRIDQRNRPRQRHVHLHRHRRGRARRTSSTRGSGPRTRTSPVGSIAGINTVDGTPSTQDCNGHGTHVSGTVGGTDLRRGEGRDAWWPCACSGAGTARRPRRSSPASTGPPPTTSPASPRWPT